MTRLNQYHDYHIKPFRQGRKWHVRFKNHASTTIQYCGRDTECEAVFVAIDCIQRREVAERELVGGGV